MIWRWVWRAVAVFAGRKAWEHYQRRQAASRDARPPRRGRRYSTR